MEPGTSLVASAQISVAISGFAGIVASFRNESVHKWSVVERFWLRLLLLNSILPLASAMFGLFVLAVAPVSTHTWRWCSAFVAACLVPYAVSIQRNLRGFAPGQLQAAGGRRTASYMLFCLLIVVCLLQILNIAVLDAFWPYFGAIVALLLGAMYQFVRLVLIPQQPDASLKTPETEEG